ncbi:heavy-metal-associated domain-containing protein [Pseudaminobacter sp. NGMCC 1.201702]|uniref:heavy-metal-associated domain-containing protein n=1 Tax=Pseudaminobacter sp. NGMCC 1.201702 TaxID=3391825 RepID=UPI0039EFDCCD
MYLFNVPNMTCGGCAKSVTKALQSVDASAKIETDPSRREVRVQSSATEADFRAVLSEAGYPVDDKPAAA